MQESHVFLYQLSIINLTTSQKYFVYCIQTLQNINKVADLNDSVSESVKLDDKGRTVVTDTVIQRFTMGYIVKLGMCQYDTDAPALGPSYEEKSP